MDHYDDRGAARALDDHEDDRAPRVRGRTISVKRLSKRDLELGKLEADELLAGITAQRPRTRAECLPGGPNEARPCPWVSCKHHLALDVNPRTGAIKLNFPALEVWELPETCALDVADRGGITLEEVGEITNLTRERVRQVESRGLASLKPLAALAGLNEDLRERARPDLAPQPGDGTFAEIRTKIHALSQRHAAYARRGAEGTHGRLGILAPAVLEHLRTLAAQESQTRLAERAGVNSKTLAHALAGGAVSDRVRAVLEAL